MTEMVIGKERVFIGLSMAGSSKNSTFEQWELDAPTRPRFGRNWWFWYPVVRTNGGRLSRAECLDVNFHWLCFSAWITFYPRRSKESVNQ